MHSKVLLHAIRNVKKHSHSQSPAWKYTSPTWAGAADPPLVLIWAPLISEQLLSFNLLSSQAMSVGSNSHKATGAGPFAPAIKLTPLVSRLHAHASHAHMQL